MLKEVELCVQQEEKIQRRARKNDQLLRDRKERQRDGRIFLVQEVTLLKGGIREV